MQNLSYEWRFRARCRDSGGGYYRGLVVYLLISVIYSVTSLDIYIVGMPPGRPLDFAGPRLALCVPFLPFFLFTGG